MTQYIHITGQEMQGIASRYPEYFGNLDSLHGLAFRRTQVSKHNRFTIHPNGEQVVQDGVIYYVYQGRLLLARYEIEAARLTWHGVEDIPTHGLGNSVKVVLGDLGVYNRITVRNTGTYRVLSRWDDQDKGQPPHYLYSGAVMELTNGDFVLTSEAFKSYGRPETGEKTSDW